MRRLLRGFGGPDGLGPHGQRYPEGRAALPRQIGDRAPEVRHDLAADGERVREITEGLGPWPDPMLTSGSLAELCVAAGLCVVEERDLTPLVAPTFEAMLGPHAIANPSSVADAGDRGTAALGALCRTGHLRVVLLKAQLKA